jgi:hypothetical protein
MTLLIKYKYTVLYILSITIVNVLFKHYPALIDISEGVQITPWTILVGTWFVLRDFSQREIGHYVFVPMIIGVALGAMISPAIAIAGLIAAGTSELLDWVVYTITKKPFHQRILLSSLIAAPVDTILFFAAFDFFELIPGVSIFNWPTVLLGTLSKLVAALIVYGYYQKYKIDRKS